MTIVQWFKDGIPHEAALVFDTETTGLTLHPSADPAKQPRMIEFGAVLLSLLDGTVLAEFQTLVNFGCKLPPEITAITGLTDADLRDAPSFAEALEIIRAAFAPATAVVAHNLPFDRQIMHTELRIAGITDFPWPARETCTVGLYRDEWGRNPRMQELYAKVMGKPLAQTHRAIDDVRALVEIIQTEQLWRVF